MRPRHLFLSLLMLALAYGEGPRIDVPDTVDVGPNGG